MGTSSEDERALDALLRDAREEPRKEDLARVERRLGPWLGAGAGAGGGAPTAVPPDRGRSSATLKGVVVAAGAGLLALSLFHVQSRAVDAPAPVAAPTSASTGGPAPAAPEPESTISVADLPSADFAPPPSTPARDRGRPAPAGGTSKPAAARSQAAQPSPPPAPSAVDEAAESEASFLRRTQATLATDPARALRMTNEHATLFPRGVLLQERDVITIDALARLGRNDEARARAEAFRARYPRSAHDSRILTILRGIER